MNDLSTLSVWNKAAKIPAKIKPPKVKIIILVSLLYTMPISSHEVWQKVSIRIEIYCII